MGGEMVTELSRGDAPRRPLARPPSKPPELEDWLNSRIYHRLSARMAQALAPTPVTPNMVSLMSFVLIVGAGLCYVGLAWPWSVALGLAAHMSWHVVDGADGDLARLTGRASAWGELIDGMCDYLGHFFLYLMIGIQLADWIGFWAYPLGLASGLSRIAQSNHSESGRRTYLWRVYGVPWLKQAAPSPEAGAGRPGLVARLFAWIARTYVAAAADPVAARLDELVRDDRTRRLCRRASRPSLDVQTAMGANYRTILLGLSMAAGSALWYFLFEVVVLNLVLVWSKRLERGCNLALLARIGP